jgi:RNA polymerase sigma-70 factor, ECF subfamily
MPAMPWELNISAAHLDLLRSRSRIRSIVRKQPGMDEAAFAAFYAETSRPLFGYLLRVSGERSVAEDLMQEAYFRFLSAALPQMNASEHKSYLFRIASNLLHDRWRRRREDPSPDDFSETAASSMPPDLRLEVRQAFQQLRPRERELLWLAYVEGSNHHEIADCTGLKAGSIRILLFRARRKLLNLLSGRSSSAGPEASK